MEAGASAQHAVSQKAGSAKKHLWRKALSTLSLLCICISAVFGYRSFARHQDLKETLLWMDQTYNPHEGGDNLGRGHGWEIHYLQKGQVEEVTEKFTTIFTLSDSCTMVIRGETLPVGVFRDVPSVDVSTLNLRDVDPTTVTVKTYDLHKDVFNCADPEEVKMFQLSCDNAEMKFQTRDGAAVISEQSVKTFVKLTGNDHELKSNSKRNTAWLLVDDVPYAQRLAKAFKHAVELCGGTRSKF